MEITYQIGDKTYIQRPLVLGQIRQLSDLLRGIVIPGNAGIPVLMEVLGDKLPEALAIVLTEKDRSPRDKNFAQMISDIEFSILPDTAFQVIEDFFDCNPIASLLGRLTEMTQKVVKTMKTGSKTSASSSPEETLQNETPSSGDTPQENANPGSNFDPEK